MGVWPNPKFLLTEKIWPSKLIGGGVSLVWIFSEKKKQFIKTLISLQMQLLLSRCIRISTTYPDLSDFNFQSVFFWIVYSKVYFREVYSSSKLKFIPWMLYSRVLRNRTSGSRFPEKTLISQDKQWIPWLTNTIGSHILRNWSVIAVWDQQCGVPGSN